MAKLVFVYKGRYWVRDTRTLETLSAMARAAGHETSLVYDPDLFGTSDNVLSLPRLNRLLFRRDAAARKAAASGADWLVFLENLTNGPWIKDFLGDLAAAGYKGRTAVFYCQGSEPAEGSLPLYGEPEKVFGELLKTLPEPAPGKMTAGGLADLDLLPLPDLDLFSPYEDFGLSYMAYAGKGCSGACSYCEEPFYRQAYGPGYARLRRPERVLDELLAVKKRFRTREITFKDSVFTADKGWLKSFLELYRREIALPFKCFGRSDAFDPETAALLKSSGCYCVEFGLQTFNEKLRASVLKRPENLASVKKAFAACDAAGLPYDADYIFGLPGATAADHIEAALRFSELGKLNRIKCHNLVYYKGLGITEHALKEGRLEESAVSQGDFFSGDRSAPEMRGADSAFRKLFKLYGLLGGRFLAYAAGSGLWRAFRFVPALPLKPLELLSGLLKGDRRFLVYLAGYSLKILRPLLKKAGLFLLAGLLTALVFIFVGEAVFGIFFRDRLKLNVWLDEMNLMYRYDRELGWFPQEGAVKDLQGCRRITVRNNSRGFRDPEPGAKTKPRIVFLGDSFVWGYDSGQDRRFTERLRALVPGWQVLNFGVCGYGTDQEYLLLRREFDNYSPDAVFVVVDGTDMEDNSRSFYNGYYKPYFVIEDVELSSRGIPVPRSMNYYFTEHRLLLSNSYLFRALFKVYYGCYAPKPAAVEERTVELLRELARFSRERGSAFLVGLGSMGPKDREKIVSFLKAEGLPWADLDLPAGYKIDGCGSHWNEAGHRVVAERIYAVMRKTGLLRAGTGGAGGKEAE